MTAGHRRDGPSRLGHWLLRLRAGRQRAADVEDDLIDLFELRRAARGRFHAEWRWLLDAGSVRRRVPTPRRRGRGDGPVAALARDVRHAVRGLRGAPTFTWVALIVLASSIGASTAIFSVVDAVVLRELPFYEPDRLVSVGEVNVRDDSPGSSRRAAPQNFLDWRERAIVFAGLAAVGDVTISLKREGLDAPEVLRAQWVTADFFPVLRVMPMLGRPLTADDEVDGRAQVAVISHGLWLRRFGGARDVVGQRLPGQLASFEIVGVMPASFAYPVGERSPTDVWVPYVVSPESRIRGNNFGYNLKVIGRLRAGVTLGQAQADMDRITAALAAETPRWFEDRVARVIPLVDDVSRGVRAWMLTLLVAVGLAMIVACVNLANLMLVRATARRHELAVRSALGATRLDLIRTLLAEALCLSLSGAALGIAVAWLGVESLRSFVPPDVPRAALIGIDVRVLSVAALSGIMTGLLFGLAPILQLTRQCTRSVSSRGRGATSGGRASRIRGLLVVSQVAIAFVLLVGATLFFASFFRVTSVGLGFEHEGVLAVRVRPLVGGAEYEVAVREHGDRLQRILEHVATLPGVQAAALVARLPLRGDLRTVGMAIPGRVLPLNSDIALNEISPDYLSVLRIPVIAGRGFTGNDHEAGEPVVILSDAATRQYFPQHDAIGAMLELDVPRRVVGIAGSIRDEGPERDARAQAYVPLRQSQPIGATLVIRTTPGADVLPAVGRTIWAEFPDLPIPDQFALDHYYEELVGRRRFTMLLMGLFGLLAVLIAGAGIYGVMAHLVSERTKEIGVRLAVGAAPASVRRMVVAQASRHVGVGLLVGLPVAWAWSRSLTAYLFEIQPHDPIVYATVASAVVATGLAAAYVPARRAARIEPVLALRSE